MCMWVCRVTNRITRACPILAGVVLFLAASPAPAQTTGGTSLGNLGGGGTGGGGGGGGGGGTGAAGGTSNTPTAGQSAFGSLGPSTGMGPTVSIGGQANARGAANGVAGTVSIPTTSNPLGSFYYNYAQYGIKDTIPGWGSLLAQH